jgi:SAM-dependent methyltransferase
MDPIERGIAVTAQPVAFACEVGRGLAANALPAYAEMLTAYHRAHAPELRAMLADLPLRPGDTVLDMACGDGIYSAWLAEHVAPHGSVVGVDIAPAFIQLARELTQSSPHSALIDFQQADIAALPFEDGTFDLVWCAQSMYSLPDPIAALRELRRVTRPGGAVAVFENDTLHHMVLPWPPELELAVRQAQLAAFADGESSDKFYIGRDLCAAFHEAGLGSCRISSYTAVRHAALDEDERTYLRCYLQDLGERARPHMQPSARAAFDRLVDPASPQHLLDRPDFCVTYIDIVACGFVG